MVTFLTQRLLLKNKIKSGFFFSPPQTSFTFAPTALSMDPEAARSARESLDLAFHMSNILDTGLDRHALSILIALCDLGVNPEALAAIVKELRKERLPLSSLHPTPPS
ncbi:mitotic-spindle organizing 1B-like protein [Medicago truncatula]|uniref:Mitotic-spindle organizing 1B-like protein n=2 Tax=Medicago truncatula TaxID=3880 RepID=A0A072VE60_MEDTR|nr:mitotic-spindle organizing 1B-like protein [Medicago truncatula]